MWDRWGPSLDDLPPHVQKIERHPAVGWQHLLDPSVIGEHCSVHMDLQWPVWGWRTQYEHASKAKKGGVYVEVPHAAQTMTVEVMPVGEILRRFPWWR